MGHCEPGERHGYQAVDGAGTAGPQQEGRGNGRRGTHRKILEIT